MSQIDECDESMDSPPNSFEQEADGLDDRSGVHAANNDDDTPDSTNIPAVEESAVVEATSKRISSEQLLHLIFDPAHAEHEKSLWQFYLKHSVKIPLFDDYVKDLEKQNPKNLKDMDKVVFQWYDLVLNAQREFIQTALEQPLDVPTCGKRIANFMLRRRHIKDQWRFEWIEKYLKHCEAQEQQSATATASTCSSAGQENIFPQPSTSSTTLDERRRAALERRKNAVSRLTGDPQEPMCN